MNSIELAKNIYEKAIAASKKTVWLSEKQEAFLFSLLYAEKKVQKGTGNHYIATVLPSGEWVDNLTLGEAIKIGQEKLKRVYMTMPPFYIRREGFKAKKLIIL